MFGAQELPSHGEAVAIESLRTHEVAILLENRPQRDHARCHLRALGAAHCADDIEGLAVERLGRRPVSALAQEHAEVVERGGDALAPLAAQAPLEGECLAVEGFRR
jgi:hypothetical protein